MVKTATRGVVTARPRAWLIILRLDADAKTPTIVYSSSGSCIASPFGFTAKLQPVNSGVSWRTTFNVVGSGDENGNVREVGQSVDSASFGVGPRMHMPAANAYTATYVSSVTGPNEDGSFTLRVGRAGRLLPVQTLG